ncbi:methylglutamate dehydrogenase [Leptolyngbya sp. FACHB-36]|uniref:methylglutamate dehydrogenase n=1 Tax=Leptolyngbya sp. FACHB-36 TaxID=2692808 RepID=UPI001680F4CB|nr:methylglutamate dehydrogenase [Leptolyngbya sp. FACHB-36]MBD2019030.1 methylglutamate dehydrogenase [Leptolyngbya sp. FACHB-36]
MTTPIRLSPIHEHLPRGMWQMINDMPTLTHVAGASIDRLAITDRSCLTRFGVKGAGAAEWLKTQGISVSDRPNTWRSLPDGGIIARLGMSEFLIEDSQRSRVTPQLAAACQSLPASVYPVLRQDLAIALSGELVNELLLQTCSVNFRAFDLNDRPVVLTTMVGVSVTVVPDDRDGLPFYRIWCDGTFGVYFWRTLVEIVEELGGSVIGFAQSEMESTR